MIDQLEKARQALADRYEFDEEIGAGGMAIVLAARDRRTGARVAVKIVRPELAGSMAAARFAREVALAGRLQHRNIVGVVASGEADGLPYLVMPRLDGESLRARITREGPLPFATVASIASDIADAIDAAHAERIVHRDLKPENVMLSGGRAVVLDFGIARAVEAAAGTTLTATGLILGTPSYMSPEQGGGAGGIDARSDIYALGRVVYEMLAGVPPFTGPTAQAILARHAVDPVPPLSTLRPTVSRSVEAAITRALAKVPADRFESAAAFVTAFSAATPPPGPVAARRGRARVAAVVAGIAALAVFSWRVNQRPRTPADAAFPDSIAVLPFTDLSGDASQQFLADGFAEAVATELGQLTGLGVKAQGSTARYRNATDSLRTIGRELRVEAVLLGSLVRQGNRIRITPRLVDLGNPGLPVLWTAAFEEDLTDILRVQARVAAQVGQAVASGVTTARRARLANAPLVNPEAYEMYQRGRLFFRAGNGPDFERSVQFFERAVAADSTFALSWAMLAEALLRSAQFYQRTPASIRDAALAAADRAVQLDSTLAQALMTRAVVRSNLLLEWLAVEPASRRGLALNPSYADGHFAFGTWLSAMGRHGEATPHFETAVRLDPFNNLYRVWLGVGQYMARNWDHAALACGDLLRFDPSDGAAHECIALVRLQQGRGDEALAAEQRAATLNPAESQGVLGYVLGRLNRASEARRLLRSLLERARQSGTNPRAGQIALVYAGLGVADSAFSWLERGFESMDPWLGQLQDPVWDVLRNDPRLERIVARRRGLIPAATTLRQ